MHHYTLEEENFIREHCNQNTSCAELTMLFNKQFNTCITINGIAGKKKKMGLKIGKNGGRFEKGRVSNNKGKKQIEFMSAEAIERTKATRFHKGNKPHNELPIGTEIINYAGYIKIKIAEDKWVFKHTYVYESHHKMKIPKNHMLVFLDGDKSNCSIENLMMISQNVNLILNMRGMRYENPEATKAAINTAILIEALNKRRRKAKDGAKN